MLTPRSTHGDAVNPGPCRFQRHDFEASPASNAEARRPVTDLFRTQPGQGGWISLKKNFLSGRHAALRSSSLHQLQIVFTEEPPSIQRTTDSR